MADLCREIEIRVRRAVLGVTARDQIAAPEVDHPGMVERVPERRLDSAAATAASPVSPGAAGGGWLGGV
jgi:hypothetical protein